MGIFGRKGRESVVVFLSRMGILGWWRSGVGLGVLCEGLVGKEVKCGGEGRVDRKV